MREWDRERNGDLFVITSTTSSSSPSSSLAPSLPSFVSILVFRKFRCRFSIPPGDAVINVTESLLSLSALPVAAAGCADTSLPGLSSTNPSDVVGGAPK